MSRYTSVTDDDLREMLATIGAASVQELFEDVPAGLRLEGPLALEDGLSEQEVYGELRALARRNVSAEDEVTFLGAGMYDHYVPALIDSIISAQSSSRHTRRISLRSPRAGCRRCSSTRPRSAS